MLQRPLAVSWARGESNVTTGKHTVIGYLGGREARAAHFDALEELFPPGVVLETEPLSLWRNPPADAAQGEETYVTKVVELVKAHRWNALALTGTPNEVLYPAALGRIRAAVGMPTTASLAASTAALQALGVRRTLLLTPFDQTMNASVEQLFAAKGIKTVLPRDAFGSIDEAGALAQDGVFNLTRDALSEASEADSICFQGARLDAVQLLDRLESELGLPVVASNQAMLWHVLSELGHQHTLPRGGWLLREWPTLPA
jgi:hypothetical protein